MSSRTRPTSAATRTARRRADGVKAAAAAALLLLAGCLSQDEQDRLGVFRYNAKAYYDAGDYARAEDQCRRGLQIDDEDESLMLQLAYSLLLQATPAKLEEAAARFADGVGPFGSDDWRLRLGHGMTLQQLARVRAAAREASPEKTVEPRRDEAAELRRTARAELEAAEESSIEGRSPQPEIAYHLALLDLDEARSDLFPVHAEQAIARLRERAKLLDVELRQPMGVKERERTERDRTVNAERGQRIAREAARLAWETGDWKKASQAMDALDSFGPLARADFYDRARIREQSGDAEGAVRDLEKFITFGADTVDETVTRAVESLTRLRAALAERRTAAPLSAGR